MKRVAYVIIAVSVTVSVLIGSLVMWYIYTHGSLSLGGLGPRRVGQSVELLGLKITVTLVTTTDRYQCGPEYWNYREADPGEDLIIFEVIMKNTANYPVAFTGIGAFYFYMVNSYGTRYDETTGDVVCLGESSTYLQYTNTLQHVSGYGVLTPGTEVRGKEMFRVPENSPGLEIVLSSRQITSYHWDGQSIHGVRKNLWPIEESWKL